MTRGDDLRRQDIMDACSELATVLANRGTTDETILLRAAERLLEINGEAAPACSDDLRSGYPDVDWPGITGLRVVLAHHYHRTQPDLIWQFATTDAPRLQQALGGRDPLDD